MLDLDRVLGHAIRWAEGAGALVDSMHDRCELEIDYKGDVEPVTNADQASDRLLRSLILEEFPSHRILSEEGPASNMDPGELQGPVWVIDPIDGTANYSRGHRYVAISVAFCLDGVVLVGVVHAPWLAETFTAIRGRGAFLNGSRIGVSDATVLSRAVVSTGFPHRRENVEPLVERVRRLLTHCQDIRRSASPALDIAWVAAGRLDAHTESLAPWDVAAACLVAQEAGAQRGFLSAARSRWPEDLRGDGLLISAPGIHADLVRLLRG